MFVGCCPSTESSCLAAVAVDLAVKVAVTVVAVLAAEVKVVVKVVAVEMVETGERAKPAVAKALVVDTCLNRICCSRTLCIVLCRRKRVQYSKQQCQANLIDLASLCTTDQATCCQPRCRYSPHHQP